LFYLLAKFQQNEMALLSSLYVSLKVQKQSHEKTQFKFSDIITYSFFLLAYAEYALSIPIR